MNKLSKVFTIQQDNKTLMDKFENLKAVPYGMSNMSQSKSTSTSASHHLIQFKNIPFSPNTLNRPKKVKNFR